MRKKILNKRNGGKVKGRTYPKTGREYLMSMWNSSWDILAVDVCSAAAISYTSLSASSCNLGIGDVVHSKTNVVTPAGPLPWTGMP